MKRGPTRKQVKHFHRLLSVRMTDFDCGKLCASKNGDIPFCCDNREVAPVLYEREYRWLKKCGDLWKRMPVRTKAERKLVEESLSFYVFARCRGHTRCSRALRSIACRTFPFEPFVDERGCVVGLIYQDEHGSRCPLVGKPRRAYNPNYITNALRFWWELLESLPEERKMYAKLSRERERLARRLGKSLRVFRERG